MLGGRAGVASGVAVEVEVTPRQRTQLLGPRASQQRPPPRPRRRPGAGTTTAGGTDQPTRPPIPRDIARSSDATSISRSDSERQPRPRSHRPTPPRPRPTSAQQQTRQPAPSPAPVPHSAPRRTSTAQDHRNGPTVAHHLAGKRRTSPGTGQCRTPPAAESSSRGSRRRLRRRRRPPAPDRPERTALRAASASVALSDAACGALSDLTRLLVKIHWASAGRTALRGSGSRRR